MAAAQRFGRGMVMSPCMNVRWGPFESTTIAMQRCGWDFAVEPDPHGRYLHVVARHQQDGLTLVMRGEHDHLMRSAFGDSWGARPDELTVVAVAHDTKLVYTGVDLAKLCRVDMMPEYCAEPITRKSLASTSIFRPWVEGGQQIIVEPKTVEALLAEIKSMQQPELAEIRRRNRSRERAHHEETVAQVIAFAA